MPSQYSLTLVLTWLTSVKTNNDLKNFEDDFVTQKQAVLNTVPTGYSGAINQSLIQIAGINFINKIDCFHYAKFKL